MARSTAIIRIAVSSALLAALAEGHGWMTYPPSRNGGSLSSGATVDCVGNSDEVVPDCNWFTSSTTIPGEPTICDPGLLTTLLSIENNCSTDHERDFTRKHPWRAPGTAPVIHPCGTHCTSGAAPSCDWGNVAGPIWGFPNKNQVNWTALPPTKPVLWKRGSSVEVAAGIALHHSGGWSYRVCPAGAELTEECFEHGTLTFSTDTAKVQPMDASHAAPFTIPVRHTPDRKWTRIPVPAMNKQMPAPWCKSPYIELQKQSSNFTGGDIDRYICDIDGKCASGDDWCWNSKGSCCDCKGTCVENIGYAPAFAPPSFPPLFKAVDGLWNYTIVEKVDIPEDLPTGDYVLSWRWDAEMTPQVWLNCADIRIIEGDVHI